jgi:hypothetical protein
MSVPTPRPRPAPRSVFVDESGRRRARARVVMRTLVGCAAIYVLVVIAGLTSSVSLPGVHLGVLAQAPPGREQAGRLGARSKVLPLPAALEPRPLTAGARSTAETSPDGFAAPGAIVTRPSNGVTATTGTPSTNGRATTTRPALSTTTVPVTTTTTRAHGRPTSTTHRPPSTPSTNPGVGKGRAKL